MIKRLFFLLTVFSHVFILQAGEGASKRIKLQWLGNSNGQKYYSVFFNSTIYPKWGYLPCYETTVDINPSDSLILTLNVFNVDTVYNGLERIIDSYLASDDWEIATEYFNNHVDIYILPLKKSGKDIIRIDDFELDFKIKKDCRTPKESKNIEYADNSVLSSGQWFKIGVVKNGIYKIDYDFLESNGIDPASIDPEKIRIYGNYTGMLPEANDKPRIDDLKENRIKVVGAEDGTFDKNDYILFYGKGPVVWNYNKYTGNYYHTNNLYSDTVFYFLNFDKGEGKRVLEKSQAVNTEDEVVNTFVNNKVIDHDLINLTLSGKLWVGEEFNNDTSNRLFTFYFPGKVANENTYVRFTAVGKSRENSYFSLKVNGLTVIDSALVIGITPSSHYYAKKVSRAKMFKVPGDTLNFNLIYGYSGLLSKGWLDYIEVSARCSLNWKGETLEFTNPDAYDSLKIFKYELSNVNGDISVWDITDPFEIGEMDYDFNNDTVGFKITGRRNQKFIAFTNSHLNTPVSFRKIENQNLHSIQSANLVIVTAPEFLDEAVELAAIHNDDDNLKTVVVTPGEVYNEFSSGMQDICAIRDFMRMLYKKGAFGDKPPYLLLFGDASFDYKDRIPGNTNFIPVFESEESLWKIATYGSDDFYGLLDDDEGFNASGILDVGIGRFPVSTKEEAETAVKKIKHYKEKSPEVMKDWRNNVCLVADDEDLNLHLIQAESLAAILDTTYPELNINKIYIDAFTREKISAGYRYPEVNVAIDEQVESGTLIMNYTGHGGLDGWSEEKILTLPMIHDFHNYDKMPLFITATCEFSRYDDPLYFSAGEQLFSNPHGGAIALLTTSRLAFAHANVILNRRIYKNLKNKEGNELPRLGDLIRMSKNPSNTSFLNFVLLGDPALMLAYPRYDILTDSIFVNKSYQSDTVKALSLVSVKGRIVNNGQTVSNFNGYLYPKVFDKKSEYYTRANSPKSLRQLFRIFDKVLYDGIISVKNGEFEFDFIVPENINPETGYGKISYYAYDTVNKIDAAGVKTGLIVGGMDTETTEDNNGPEIELKITGGKDNEEGVFSDNVEIEARLFDESGINYTGLGIGRDITLTLDDDFANTLILNKYFVPDIDSYTSGSLKVPLRNLTDGEHTVTLKAWDIQNNSSEKQMKFFVDKNGRISLRNINIYPNPFTGSFYMGFDNNKTGQDLNLDVSVYDITGKKTGGYNTVLKNVSGHETLELNWNDITNGRVKNVTGVFFISVTITESNGTKQHFSGKLVKLPE